jgi:RHH-type proline utilization regulon transcriptional repressor/proline dehydrogenase/delta 1-pyrroline-5-carboxylate dehydrogenase
VELPAGDLHRPDRAALAAGNAVLAKPAEQTPLIAALAVSLLAPRRRAGDRAAASARRRHRGRDAVRDPRVAGVCLHRLDRNRPAIRRSMADHLAPEAPLIAETGGLNAMMVDSTALPEQAVRDILASSFQSAGQRCSALRCLYLQEDIAAPMLTEMLFGAMEELRWAIPGRSPPTSAR